MNLTPWRNRSMSPISSLQDEMNRMFEDFFTRPMGFPLARANGQGEMLAPALDVKEDDGTITVTAELPGIDRDNIEINVDDDILEIRGHKHEQQKRDGENFHVVERSYGSFSRRIRLPAKVDSDKAEASMDKGVLTLELPKTEPTQGRKTISIK